MKSEARNVSDNKEWMSELTRDQQEGLMREALAEAERGMAEGEAPIGCVLAMGQGRTCGSSRAATIG